MEEKIKWILQKLVVNTLILKIFFFFLTHINQFCVTTYGFCSAELNKHIPKNNYPKLDQHAGHELNKKGNSICERLGFAVDFIVPDVPSLKVAKFIASKLSFDRLYYYGNDRPIHVSLNQNPIHSIVLMKLYGHRRIPSRISKEKFINNNVGF